MQKVTLKILSEHDIIDALFLENKEYELGTSTIRQYTETS